ncbi:MAG TPA: protein kinase [Pyrinomonadaceae bacterium]|nr:protein kinase [Pyrinomonadaceae bacterium]
MDYKQSVETSQVFHLGYRALKTRWRQLCTLYLPIAPGESLWRYSRNPRDDDPAQGWKLHIPATILNAVDVLEIVGPVLAQHAVLFKAPVSLGQLDRLNSGIFYGYSQVGKFITVYPRTTKEALVLAQKLNRLTREMQVPSVPFDFRYRPHSSVYYRYGAFKTLEEAGKQIEHTIRDPRGNLIPDDRNSATKPDWITDPFRPKRETQFTGTSTTFLQTTFKVFRAITQRGKGGVYQALDISVTPLRFCILKEGRKNGEVEWDGRDGSWRIKHEAEVLTDLRAHGVKVPRVYASFEVDRNHYLAAEYIEGENVEEWLTKKKRRLSITAALRVCLQYARLMSEIHRAGWVWRDCKPRNLIRTKTGEVRPIDFEGACSVCEPDPMPYGTSSYLPPEWNDVFRGQSRLPEDLYALGVVLYLVFAGRLPDEGGACRINHLRRDVPKAVLKIIETLLCDDPQKRLPAHSVVQRLDKILSAYN